MDGGHGKQGRGRRPEYSLSIPRLHCVSHGAKHCLANAVGWADRVATRNEILADEKELLAGVLSAPELLVSLTTNELHTYIHGPGSDNT